MQLKPLNYLLLSGLSLVLAGCGLSSSNSSSNSNTTVPLSVSLGSYSPTAPVAGQAVNFSVSSPDSSLTYTWAFSDGTGTTTGSSVNHSFPQSGQFTVTVTATDGKGDSGSANERISVAAAVTAVALPVSPAAPSDGQSVSFGATGSGGIGQLSYSWNFGDGSANLVGGSSVSHVYLSGGSFNVALTVTDSLGNTGSTSEVVTVQAVAQTGKVVDGYVDGASVTLDTKDTQDCRQAMTDPANPVVLADAGGNYRFDASYGLHMVCAAGGTDTSTTQPFLGVLSAPYSASVVTPLSSLAMALAVRQKIDTATAAYDVAYEMGLSSSVDLLNADPLASGNLALLQANAAAQLALTQTAAGILAAAGGGSLLPNSVISNSLYLDAASGMAQAMSTVAIPAMASSVHAPLRQRAKASVPVVLLTSTLLTPAIANALNVAAGDATLAGLSAGIAALNGTNFSAFVSAALTAPVNTLLSASSSSLSQPGGALAKALASPGLNNALSALANLLLTNPSAQDGLTATTLAGLAGVALVNGQVAAPSTILNALQADLTTIPLLSALLSNSATALTAALNGANNPSNISPVLAVTLATGGGNTALSLSNDVLNQTATLSNGLQGLTLALGTVAQGSAVVAGQSGSITLTFTASGASGGTVSVNLQNVSFVQSPGGVLSGSISTSSPVQVTATSANGAQISSSLAGTAVVTSGVFSFSNGSLSLNLNALQTLLGSGSASLGWVGNLIAGTGLSGQTVNVVLAVSGLNLATISANPVATSYLNLALSFN